MGAVSTLGRPLPSSNPEPHGLAAGRFTNCPRRAWRRPRRSPATASELPGEGIGHEQTADRRGRPGSHRRQRRPAAGAGRGAGHRAAGGGGGGGGGPAGGGGGGARGGGGP